jgi:3-phosphoshikimate 1-carboxyvinyltransferase
MALPLALNDSEIIVNNLKSRPYIDMTTGILNDFGIVVKNEDYRRFTIAGRQKYIEREYEVEGDWSGGAFLLVAGAINGDLNITGLRPDSLQSDRAILDALESAGAKVIITEKGIEVAKSELRSFEFDATESPDLFPPLVTLASYCRGTSAIRGASRLKHKESDRAQTLAEEFGRMGVSVTVKEDILYVTGGRVNAARVMSHDDHRIAMAEAVAALGATGSIAIKDSHSVSKSYPGFFTDLTGVGAAIAG